MVVFRRIDNVKIGAQRPYSEGFVPMDAGLMTKGTMVMMKGFGQEMIRKHIIGDKAFYQSRYIVVVCKWRNF